MEIICLKRSPDITFKKNNLNKNRIQKKIESKGIEFKKNRIKRNRIQKKERIQKKIIQK
jgi:hypothetical protein